MKNISLIFTILIIYSLDIVIAQAPAIEWQNTIGGNYTDYLRSIQQTNDGGYILGGYSSSQISGDKTGANQGGDLQEDYWVVKLDGTGQTIEWQNTIGGNDEDFLYSIQQTTDGGYILGGTSKSDITGDKTENNHGESDYWVVKLDATGQTIEWQNTIGGNLGESLSSIQQTTDGGYILGGHSSSGISGDKTEITQGSYDYWVVKLDATGQTIEWQNTIGGSGNDALCSIQQTADGGYILGGTSNSGITGDKTEENQGGWGDDYWVVKLDATGQTIEWQNTIGGNLGDYLYSIQQTTDGGYILGGRSSSGISGDKTEITQGSYDYWVVKLDGVGNIYWQNTIGGNQGDELYSIQQTADGGYILGGYSGSGVSGDKVEASQGTYGMNDYWVVKLDGVGNIYWQNTIGGNQGDELYSIQQTADGGYILGGYSESHATGDKTEDSKEGGWYDYWVVKLNADTPLTVEQTANTSTIEKFTVLPAYPNPFNPNTTITYGIETDNKIIIDIYDITGQFINTLQNGYQTRGWNSVIWNGTNQNGEKVPAGLYFGKITSGNEVKTAKLMLLK